MKFNDFHYFQDIEKQIYRSEKCLIQRKNSKDYGKTLASSKKRLIRYLIEYESYFQNKTKRFFDKAEKYSLGILKSHMRNIERISEELKVDYFQMQHFITESNWDARQVTDKVALNFLVSSFILKEKLICFDDAPLLSARDIKEFIVFELYKKMSKDQMIDRIFNRHLIRQRDINKSFTKNSNLSK